MTNVALMTLGILFLLVFALADEVPGWLFRRESRRK